MMMLIQEINILQNKKLVIFLNLLALPLWVIFLLAFSGLVWLLDLVLPLAKLHSYSGWEGIWFLVSFVVLIIVHESIHGLFFKLYRPENKVKFGIKWKQGMAYATSPGSLYKRGQMLAISLAPFVLISLNLTLFLIWGWLDVFFYLILVSCHAAACVGDFYYAYILLFKHKKIAIRVEDTEFGLRIYQA